MYSFPNVKMHLAQGLKHSDGKSCFLSSLLRPVFPEHHAQAEVGDASGTGDKGQGWRQCRGPRWLLSALGPARDLLGRQVTTALLTWSFN